MLVGNGRIIKTGYQLTPPAGCEMIDLCNSTVFAAFSDSHVHFTQTGITLMGIQLEDAGSIDNIMGMVAEEAKSAEYVLGWGLQEHKLKERRVPTFAELDKACSKSFVWLARKDLHSAVLNSTALKWAKTIITGLQHENGLISGNDYNRLSYKLCDHLSKDFKMAGMKKAEQACFKMGVSTVHTMEGCAESSADTLAASDFFNRSQLNGVIYHQSPDPSVPLKMGWKHMGGCLLVDGSFGTRSAALNEPYSDQYENFGNLYLKAEDIESLLKTAGKNKLQLALHAIGDRAIDTVAACYAWADQTIGRPELAHRIEHFILPGPKALMSARDHQISISIQPAFDHFWGGSDGLYAARLGYDRAMACNPFKTMLDLGIQLAGGSDSPVTPIDPMAGVASLVNHNNHEERIDLNSALALFISEPHKLSGKDSYRGHLRPDYLADFICFAEDPFTIPASRLRQQTVKHLFIKGQKVV